jgi:hypothetical protein
LDKETTMNLNRTESTEAASGAGMGATADPAASPRRAGRVRARFASGLRFARHLLGMVVAMMVGMGAFGLALAAFGEPPGYANLFVRYGLMGASMAAPMVGWMRLRGHAWSDGGEMAAAMLLPMLAPVALVEADAARLPEGSLMVVSHVAMVGGMVALMIYRLERYAQGPRGHRQ